MPPKSTEIQAHFIPNAHLDREWTIDFHHTRYLTVLFLDKVIELMREIPGYCYLLDSQSVPLEDYFEIRPENKMAVARLMRAGRLQVGPWYTALDMNCVSGESVVRNLLIGHLVAESYGPVMKVGYTPFGWGQISQLPQIYNGFGIDFCVFYRGITPEQAPKTEFLWEGSDGSVILASRLGEGARCNFTFPVWRESIFTGNPSKKNRELDWTNGEMPFKYCNEENRYEHGRVLNPASKKLDGKALQAHFRQNFDLQQADFSTNQIAYMHGMDTCMPDMLEYEAVKQCRKHLRKNESFFLSSLPRFTESVKRVVDKNTLATLRGELKHFQPDSRSLGIANDIISCRSRQKALTDKTETMLTRRTEPLALIADMLGRPWPKQYLAIAWKTYLKCLPHDTIAGCSIDKVEEDATHRLQETQSIANLVLEESLAHIQCRIDNSGSKKQDILLTVFNPSPFERSECITTYVAIPRELGITDFTLLNDTAQKIPCEKYPTGHFGALYRDRTDLAQYSSSDEYRIVFEASAIPPLGYRTFTIRKGAAVRKQGPISTGRGVLENRFLLVKINADGTLDMTDKETGRQYVKLHYFEDSGEIGHAWTHRAPFRDKTITSKNGRATVRLVENSALHATYAVKYVMMVPETTHFSKKPGQAHRLTRRSNTLKPIAIASHLTLRKDGRSLEVKTRIDNTCKNHRLRLMLPTGLKTDVSHAETAFDVVARRIPRDEKNPYGYLPHLTFNFLHFVDLNDSRQGFSFIGNGLKEYEALDDAKRTIAVTLIRACEIRLCTTSYASLENRPGDLSQGLGINEFQYYLCPHAHGWAESFVQDEAERLNVPLSVCQAACSPGGTLPRIFSFVEIKGKNIRLSALKKGDRDNAIIVRVYNPSRKDATGKLRFYAPVAKAYPVNMNEEKTTGRISFSGRNINLKLPHGKIETIALTLRT